MEEQLGPGEQLEDREAMGEPEEPEPELEPEPESEDEVEG